LIYSFLEMVEPFIEIVSYRQQKDNIHLFWRVSGCAGEVGKAYTRDEKGNESHFWIVGNRVWYCYLEGSLKEHTTLFGSIVHKNDKSLTLLASFDENFNKIPEIFKDDVRPSSVKEPQLDLSKERKDVIFKFVDIDELLASKLP
jgi:hypothetical protein